MNSVYLRTDHYGYERRPEYSYSCIGLVPKRDPWDWDWWRPLIVVVTYAPLSAHPPIR